MQQFEFVVRFTCPLIQNQDEFYTDSNGLEILKRTLVKHNKAANSTKASSNFISDNYYPVAGAIMINSTGKGKTV